MIGPATAKSIQVLGTSTIELSGYLNLSEASSFSSNTTINWSTGGLNGGATINNLGTINLITADSKVLTGNSTLNNSGTINFSSGGDLAMSSSTINNTATGIINMKTDGGNFSFFSGQGTLNNQGTIKRALSSGTAVIGVILNNSGVINTESGILDIDNGGSSFTGGTYNVTSGAKLRWLQVISCSGTLTGIVNGDIEWAGQLSVPSVATFNFSGNSPIKMDSGTLMGGGTLNNQSKINVVGVGNSSIVASTTLNNTGILNLTSAGDLAMSNSTINNSAAGVINLQANNGNFSFYNGQGTINNLGIIKRTSTTGTAVIEVILNNSGTINTESGILEINSSASSFSSGIYNVTAGAKMKWLQVISCSGTLTGAVDGAIEWAGQLSVPTNATFNFNGNSSVQMSSGILSGGGILNNQSAINVIGVGNSSIIGNTTLNNTGLFNLTSVGDFAMSASIFNNAASGTINMQADTGNFSFFNGTGTINNVGQINRTISTGNAAIDVILNNSGTLNVTSGTLQINNGSNALTGGTYNVSNGSFLEFLQPAIITGNLIGQINGSFAWASTFNIPTAQTAFFNFTGSQPVLWKSGFLTGGGNLTNNYSIKLTTTDSKSISNATLVNNGTISMASTGLLFFSSATLNNQLNGVIDFTIDGAGYSFASSAFHIINNFGLIKKSAGIGTVSIPLTLNNSGIIDIQLGTLDVSAGNFTNNNLGKVMGNGTIMIPLNANYANSGVFSPGGSPGILTIVGNQKNTATSILEVEINGITAETQYDRLTIQGNAVINGSIAVTLGFSPTIGNVFVVATTTGTITQCDINPFTIAIFNGNEYAFNVTCRNDNEVILTLAGITLSTADYASSDKKILLFPNPAKENISLNNESNLNLISASIIDLNGRIIKTVNLKNMGTEKNIPLTGISPGSYLIKIYSETKSMVKKFIIK